MKPLSILILLSTFLTASFGQKNTLEELLEDNRELFGTVLDAPEQFQVQVLYTRIDRDSDNNPHFTTFSYGVDTNLYFYPASTVKMPAAFLALEKLNRLGIDKKAAMLTGASHPPQTAVYSDTSAENGMPSIAHYIKKIFLVSDNDAYNRIYEFLGQAYLNAALWQKGYERLRIIHRLSAPQYNAQTNRFTNPVSFLQRDTLIYHQGEVYSRAYPALGLEEQVRGKGYMNQKGEIVIGPFDFRYKNYVSLQDLHDMLKSVMFPDAVAPERRFDLNPEDYRFLYKYMSMLPRESKYPAYPQYADWDSYVKFFLFGDTQKPMPDHIRVFNKVGDAYGFLTDVAYVVDFKNKVEFMLAANIHVNKNQIFNDGVYEYEDVGFPFLANLGRAIYEYELRRKRELEPDLSKFQIDYSRSR